MNKKIVAIFSVVIVGLGSVILVNINSTDRKILEQTFMISAVYYENDDYVEIIFIDTSNKTKRITLEILGMTESFHKEYSTQSFVEKIQFIDVPKYGWQSIPITLLVEHKEFGKIGIKTEIRSVGEIPSQIIFSKL